MPEKVFWGRKMNVSQVAGAKCAVAIVLAPAFVLFLSASLQFFDGSITESLQEVWSHGLKHFVKRYFSEPGVETVLAYGNWIAFQALLYSVLPGKVYNGQPTPGGYTLKYNINGLLTFFVTVLVFVWAGMGGMVDAAWIARNWQGLLVAANLFGAVFSVLMYCKARLAPTNPRDTRFSGEYCLHAHLCPVLLTFLLNRLRPTRPLHGLRTESSMGKGLGYQVVSRGTAGDERMGGGVSLTLSTPCLYHIKLTTARDLSFAMLQWQEFGRVSNSMVIAILLHTIYVIDFFYNEDWFVNWLPIFYLN